MDQDTDPATMTPSQATGDDDVAYAYMTAGPSSSEKATEQEEMPPAYAPSSDVPPSYPPSATPKEIGRAHV